MNAHILNTSIVCLHIQIYCLLMFKAIFLQYWFLIVENSTEEEAKKLKNTLEKILKTRCCPAEKYLIKKRIFIDPWWICAANLPNEWKRLFALWSNWFKIFTHCAVWFGHINSIVCFSDRICSVYECLIDR